MAIDRWLLQQHQLGQHPPTLRFYTWESPTISLGYHQRRFPAFWQQLIWEGKPISLVRRPTGGRAVLHQGDLTYMAIASGLSVSRIQAYEKICEFLIQGWRSLGLELHYGLAERGYIHNPNCFGTSTGADLVSPEGVKFIGSAQLRQKGAILQHGSMRLQPDAELFTKVFGEAAPPPVKLPLVKEGDEGLLTIIEALTQAACQCFKIELVVEPLSAQEYQEILALPDLQTI
jgi:lipoate-protein ligase A